MNTTLTCFLPDEAALLAFAEHFAECLPDKLIVFLHGSLGAGKTTFSRGLLRGLGYQGKVKSPTYTLVEPYYFGEKKLYHFDLYRLIDPNELEFIGIQDYFSEKAICVIEWPLRGGDRLPHSDIACYLDFYQSGRIIKCIAESPLGELVIKKMNG